MINNPRMIALFVVTLTICATIAVAVFAQYNYRYRIRADGCSRSVVYIPPFYDTGLPRVYCELPKFSCYDSWHKETVTMTYCPSSSS